MTIERLILLSLQYLEKDSDINVTEMTFADIENNDLFSEYLKNMEHTVQMGLMRLSTSLVLPIQEYEISGEALLTNNRRIDLKLATGESIAHKIAHVYKIDNNNNLNGNIAYNIIGSKILVKDKVLPTDTYIVTYHPRMFDLERYRGENEHFYDINLANLTINDTNLGQVKINVPDEMATMIKYFIYSDLKMEDEPKLATINKNYFESYLSDNATIQVVAHETNVKGMNFNEDTKAYYGLDPLDMAGDDYE